MKKALKNLAAVAVLCSMAFLGGEWPENTPRRKVIAADGVAIAVMLCGGIYLKKTEDKRNG